jgi:predicted dehydrogenase
MEKIKAAVIGLGRIASLLEDDALREKPCTHSGAIAANSECILATGCDTDEERRRLFAERWDCPVYAGAASMLAEIKPGIVHIATHPDSHYFYCRLAADAGVPVIVCEKPLAETLADAKKIAALHSGGVVKIITNHERRYSADYLRAKKILDEGSLGPVLSVGVHLYMGKNQCLLDVLWHDGTHLADAAMFLCDARLRSRGSRGAKLTARAGTAWLEGLLEKTGGEAIPFIMEIGAGRDYLVFELEFSCAQGRLRIGNGIFEVWESVPSTYAEKFHSLKRTEEIFEGPTGYFANMVDDAVSCYRDSSRQPRSSALDGLAVIKYLTSIKPWRGPFSRF